jgi:CSLREA domain-containing protein
MSRRMLRISIGFILPALVGFAVPPAAAAIFTVNSEADVTEVSPGNGSCNPEFALPGVCTLRAAVQEANALAGADTIFLTAGQTYTLTRVGGDDTASNGDLDITDALTIVFFASGERPVVDAGEIANRAFHVLADNVHLFGFDITGGNAEHGGGILVFSPGGSVQLSYLRVYGNSAQFGGGLYNDVGDVTITASEFHDNQFVGDINGTASGSAIRNTGNLAIDHSSFHDNRGVLPKGVQDVEGLTTTANAIDSAPDGVGTGEVTIRNSTLVGNIGNAINMQHDGYLLLVNTTIAANTIRGVRIAGTGGEFRMRNSVIARNAFADCSIIADGVSLNLDRYNVDSDDSCELSSGSTNLPGIDPLLTPLTRHGGATRVSWPLAGSPLLDSGHLAIGETGCESDDQHFIERPVDFDGNGNARCDIGSVEMTRDVIFFYPFETL